MKSSLSDELSLHELFVYQPGLRAHHSTGPDLDKVINDLVFNTDVQGASTFLMSDLSAAFDSEDLSGHVLNGVFSYDKDRSCSINLTYFIINNIRIFYSDPQRLIMGLVISNLYMLPLNINLLTGSNLPTTNKGKTKNLKSRT